MFMDIEEVEPTKGERAENDAYHVHDFKVNGVCAECYKRNDLPTLPLNLVQTPGGYKAIEDSEGRHVTFVGMREDDKAWGEFLINPVNRHAKLLEALRVAKAEIRALHDRLFPDGWGIYETYSPEMTQINAALNPKCRAALAFIDSLPGSPG